LKDKKPIEIVDIRGKDSLKCPNCGLTTEIPPRTVSMESLRHMQVNQWFMRWEKEHGVKSQSLGNVRMTICPHCQQPIILKDEFTIEKKE